MTLERSFKHFFQRGDSRRDNFLARLLGLFSEDLIAAWCECPQCPWVNLGRPTLSGHTKRLTLDFTLRERNGDKIYFAEMKCWITFDNYKHLRLESAEQLGRMARLPGQAGLFRFLTACRDPDSISVTIGGKPVVTQGGILIWASVSQQGRNEVIESFQIHEVLSVEDVLDDLVQWQPEHWLQRVVELRKWSSSLYSYLLRGTANEHL